MRHTQSVLGTDEDTTCWVSPLHGMHWAHQVDKGSCCVQVGPAKKARRSRTSGATSTSKATSKAPAKRKAAPKKKAAPLAPPVGTRQRGGVHSLRHLRLQRLVLRLRHQVYSQGLAARAGLCPECEILLCNLVSAGCPDSPLKCCAVRLP